MPSSITLFLKALTDVQATIAAHIEPGEHLDPHTVATLRTILADPRLIAAMSAAATKPDGLEAIEGVREVFAEFAKDLGAPFGGEMPIVSLRNPAVGQSYFFSALTKAAGTSASGGAMAAPIG
jgi:hypothetical protein